MQNFFSGMGGGGEGEAGPADNTPIWMKYAGKGTGVVGGCVAIFMGFFCVLSPTNLFSPMCIVAGVWQIIAGLVLVLVEAPFCAKFIPPLAKFTQIVEARPPWQRAAVYLAISLPPIFMCIGISTVIGSGLIFAVAVLYGMMTVGKKASREEMAAAANVSKSASASSMKSGLVGNIHGQDVESAKQGGKS